MTVRSDYVQWVVEQLSGAGRITARRLFGGVGLYRNDVFFAIISRDVLYFKVGNGNRSDYAVRGMAQFRPFTNKPRLSMSYYEVPADVLEDTDTCVLWVQRAVAAAQAVMPGVKAGDTLSAKAAAKPAAKSAAKPAAKAVAKRPARKVRF